jgi:capsular exopolysaccharide synthesis family protein
MTDTTAGSASASTSDGIGAVLLRRTWTVLAVTGVVMLVALGVSMHQTRQYTSQARVLVSAAIGSTDGAPNMADEKQIASSTGVAGMVVDRLNLAQTPTELLRSTSVSVPVDTSILVFDASATSARQAQRVAGAYAQAYIDFRRDQMVQQVESGQLAIEEQIEVLTGRLGSIRSQIEAEEDPRERAFLAAQATSLTRQIDLLGRRWAGLTVSDQMAAELLEPAGLPDRPSRPNYPVNMAIALILGLALGVVAALVQDRLDDRVRGSNEIVARLGAPLLGSIPRIDGPEPGGQLIAVGRPGSIGTEAFRQLRANLLLAAEETEARVILVTSSSPTEGKTFVVANLGVTLARARQRVIVVSADVCRPLLEDVLGVEPDAYGLVDVLGDGVALDKVLVDVGVENLELLPSGSVHRDPEESLDPSGLHPLMRDLRHRADIVLVEGPPLPSDADAIVLAPACDAAVVVVDVRTTTRAEVAEVGRQFGRVRTPVLGGVAVNTSDRGAVRHGYGAAHPSSTVGTASPNGPVTATGSGDEAGDHAIERTGR